MIKTVLLSVVAVLGVALLLAGLLWLFQRRLIYLPDTRPVPAAATVLPGARDVTLTTADGLRLGAWYVPGRREVTVLVMGGNAGNRSHRAPLAAALAREGFAVLLMDYRGYGGNAGSPTEEGLALDAEAARQAVNGKVIYYGESLGAAVATRLATKIPPDGLLLRSPFTDLADAGRHAYPFLPVRPLLRDTFPVKAQLRTVHAPITIVYGSADTIVPPALSRSAAPPGAVLVEVPGAGHNDQTLLDGPELMAAVVDLAQRV